MIKKIKSALHLDLGVLFIIGVKLWSVIAAPVSIFLIASYFTPEIQGYYYTFNSLLGLQTFLELSLYLVILNFASHEWAHLSFKRGFGIQGDPEALSRLSSLLRFVFKWYSYVGILFICIVSIVGFYFLSQKDNPQIHWVNPWFLLVFMTGIQLCIMPIFSLLEGCNQIVTVNSIKLVAGIATSITLWFMIAKHQALWAPVVSLTVNVIVCLVALIIFYGKFLKQLWDAPRMQIISWKDEIWPVQWRLALAGVVSYFSFSLFTPVMFQYYGSAVAGQMGMSFQTVYSIGNIAFAWIEANTPKMGSAIAKSEFKKLDHLFFRLSAVSIGTVIIGSILFYFLLCFLRKLQLPLVKRLLEPNAVLILLVANIFFVITRVQAAYLRAHKKEPLMLLSVVCSLIIGVLVIYFGKNYGPIGASLSYFFVIVFLMAPWMSFIWYRSRKEWHKS